ncbi:hypothetical protein DENSPDRAFT_848979 [Dentipellis sp. KUC8613]|nr:hypothetical protein DENSPDRAFT_848979 [Dentipellis sp. KUC8613]
MAVAQAAAWGTDGPIGAQGGPMMQKGRCGVGHEDATVRLRLHGAATARRSGSARRRWGGARDGPTKQEEGGPGVRAAGWGARQPTGREKGGMGAESARQRAKVAGAAEAAKTARAARRQRVRQAKGPCGAWRARGGREEGACDALRPWTGQWRAAGGCGGRVDGACGTSTSTACAAKGAWTARGGGGRREEAADGAKGARRAVGSYEEREEGGGRCKGREEGAETPKMRARTARRRRGQRVEAQGGGGEDREGTSRARGARGGRVGRVEGAEGARTARRGRIQRAEGAERPAVGAERPAAGADGAWRAVEGAWRAAEGAEGVGTARMARRGRVRRAEGAYRTWRAVEGSWRAAKGRGGRVEDGRGCRSRGDSAYGPKRACTVHRPPLLPRPAPTTVARPTTETCAASRCAYCDISWYRHCCLSHSLCWHLPAPVRRPAHGAASYWHVHVPRISPAQPPLAPRRTLVWATAARTATPAATTYTGSIRLLLLPACTACSATPSAMLQSAPHASASALHGAVADPHSGNGGTSDGAYAWPSLTPARATLAVDPPTCVQICCLHCSMGGSARVVGHGERRGSQRESECASEGRLPLSGCFGMFRVMLREGVAAARWGGRGDTSHTSGG